jgi:TRAP-type C4-dicarboxylate transport system permease small subunit
LSSAFVDSAAYGPHPVRTFDCLWLGLTAVHKQSATTMPIMLVVMAMITMMIVITMAVMTVRAVMRMRDNATAANRCNSN